MMGKINAGERNFSRKHFAVLALCLVAANAIFLVFATSGLINHFIAFGVSITFALCALALLVMVAKSRRRA
ncbi:hypothetical protein GCM10007863_26080 [Dyella mobilis]|nr:hypothetical protein GCM10007863_26080 [Dyella mobilis]